MGTEGNERELMKRKFGRVGKPSPAMVVGIIALVFAISGVAVAGIPKSGLKLGMFQDNSRNTLAGTGVIQYAATAHNTGDVAVDQLLQYSVACELSKKATAGGYKWTGAVPPPATAFQYVDGYPNGSGYVVRIRALHATQLDNQTLSVFANCVKSRAQRGTPPS
jgi:hypothetical protein